MVRFSAANVETRIHSLGLRGFANPLEATSDHRTRPIERHLSMMIPALLVAFLLSMGIGAVMLMSNTRSDALTHARDELTLVAASIEAKVEAAHRRGDAVSAAVIHRILMEEIPQKATAEGRLVIVIDREDAVVAAVPHDRVGAFLGRDRGEALARTPTARETLMLGEPTLSVVRPLAGQMKQLIVAQTVADALDRWQRSALLTASIILTTDLILLILGLAFHVQASRARVADEINQNARVSIHAALECGRAGLWDWEMGSGKLYWSKSLSDMIGRPHSDDLIDFVDLAPLLHPQDRHIATLSEHLASDPAREIDLQFRMRHLDGRWIWIRARGKRIPAKGDAKPRVVGIAVDVTDQVEMETRTAAADRRIREALDTISEAFVICDAEDRIVASNAPLRELHGLTEHQARAGRCYHEAMADGAGPKVVDLQVTATDERGEARRLEVNLADGRWLQISEKRMQCGGFVSVGTDITALKRQETDLIASQRRLTATIADLQRSQAALETQTQQLVELAEKYSEQKTHAEEANRAKSEFLANMSHELRTPLNAIIGFSEIMKDGHFGPVGAPKYAEYSRDIFDSGQFLLSVIDDILDMSRIEAGRLRLDATIVDLDETLDETIRVVAKMAGDKGVALSADMNRDLEILGDRRAVKQIALNLLSNAVKFTPAGGSIKVRAKARAGHVTIAIEDTGIGIPRHALNKIGRPFEQVQSQFSKNHKGSGLGLAIARSLAELHGGALKIHSREGFGTLVVVRLPQYGPALRQAA